MINIKSIENVTNREIGFFVSKLSEDDYCQKNIMKSFLMNRF